MHSNNKESNILHIKSGHIYYAKIGRDYKLERSEMRPILVVRTEPVVLAIPIINASDKDLNHLPSTELALTNTCLLRSPVLKVNEVNTINKSCIRSEEHTSELQSHS